VNDIRSTKGKTFRAWLNPLQLLDVDEPWASLTKEVPNSETLLEYMCTPGIGSSLQDFLDRYRQISEEKARLFAAPYEERILEKLVWPLRHAKACYMVGNYLGTISLCGMVAEMVAILTFDMSSFGINDREMNPKEEKALFGRTFEKLGQARRVEILHAFGLIRDQLKDDFDVIRAIRRRYLHLWSQDHDTLPGDAVRSYNAALAIVVRTIGQDIEDGMIRLNPALVRYLERSGVFEIDSVDAESDLED